MSVLIKGMNMPKGYKPARIVIFSDGTVRRYLPREVGYATDITSYKAIEVPTADVRENVRGEWIYHKNDMSCVRWDKWECSACHNRQENKTNFCPSCGADMRKEAK